MAHYQIESKPSANILFKIYYSVHIESAFIKHQRLTKTLATSLREVGYFSPECK